MADTPNYNLPYPDDYTQLADVPAAVKDLAEATDTALEGKADTSDLGDKQDKSNLVTSLSSSSTDTQYPSAKCVYDLIGDINSALDLINGESI